MLTHAGFEIYDVRTFKLVEREPYDAWSLVSPILSHTTNGTITYSDAVSEVAHSVRVYKGKIFLLVSPMYLTRIRGVHAFNHRANTECK